MDPKAYLTDGKRLLRVECEISGGRGVILEDCALSNAETTRLISMSVKEFLRLEKVEPALGKAADILGVSSE